MFYQVVAISSVGIKKLLARKAIVILLFIAWAPVIFIGLGFFSMGTHLTQRSIGREEQIRSRLVPRIALPAMPTALFSQLLGRVATREVIEKRLEELMPLFWRVSFYKFLWLESWVLLFLALAIGPYLVTPDLRSRSLALYFSRPIGVADYLLGKAGIAGVLFAYVLLLPSVILYLTSFYFTPNSSYFKITLDLVPGTILAILSMSFIAISVLLAVGSVCKTHWTCLSTILFLTLGLELSTSFMAWFRDTYPAAVQFSKAVSLLSIPSILNDLTVWLTGINADLEKMNEIFRHEWVYDPVSNEMGRLGDMPLYGSGNAVWAVLLAAGFYLGASWTVLLLRLRRARS